MVFLEIGVVLWRTYISTLFTTLSTVIKYHELLSKLTSIDREIMFWLVNNSFLLKLLMKLNFDISGFVEAGHMYVNWYNWINFLSLVNKKRVNKKRLFIFFITSFNLHLIGLYLLYDKDKIVLDIVQDRIQDVSKTLKAEQKMSDASLSWLMYPYSTSDNGPHCSGHLALAPAFSSTVAC